MKTKNGEMSERQAARMIEMYENAMRNGEQWTHDVLFHRGTAKYEESIMTMNEAFDITRKQIVIKPLEPLPVTTEETSSVSSSSARSRSKSR
jgi:hypothetical protein